MEILNLTQDKIELKPVYGGMKVVINYYLTTKTEGIENTYKVTASIRGIDKAMPEMVWEEVKAETNNEHTLIEEAIIERLENDYE